MKQEIARHQFVDDHHRAVVIIERQEVRSLSLLAGETNKFAGACDFVTTDGQWANENDNGTFTLKDGRVVRPSRT